MFPSLKHFEAWPHRARWHILSIAVLRGLTLRRAAGYGYALLP